jgi:hypothetical protein
MVRRVLLVLLAVLLPVLGVSVAGAAPQPQGWQPRPAPLGTQWTAQVGPDNALPDYPRPQLTRPDWQNLNGVWQYRSAAAGEAPPVGQTLAQSILVPYPAPWAP